jgi:tetratricopeptide (TPR) repeat protein
MAEACLRQFENEQTAAQNAMPLAAIRGAAGSSGFGSHEELLAWLDRALGDRKAWLVDALRHARRAAELSPTQGEAYVYMAELAFLDANGAQHRSELLAQALAVRPYNSTALLAAGSDAILAGQFETGLDYWRRAFAIAPDMQVPLFDALRAHLPSEVLLRELEPDLDASRRLFQHVQNDPDVALRGNVTRYLGARLQQRAAALSGQPAANLWHEAQGVYVALDDREQAARCSLLAVEAAPGDVAVRKACAARLMEVGRDAEALKHLEMCRRCAPGDRQVMQLIAAVQERLQALPETRAASEPPFEAFPRR